MPDRADPRRQAARRALALSDRALLGECRQEFIVGGGPGGQHRNVTASAVRLVHGPTGLRVGAGERRSQARNRTEALARLRERLRALATVPEERRPTRPTPASRRRRLEAKRRRGERKARRRASFDD